MKKIIVTGGLGFIGSNLIKLLIKKNYFVINIDKFNYDGDFTESQAFAYLAIRSYLKKNIS